jgi:hypothetical protein
MGHDNKPAGLHGVRRKFFFNSLGVRLATYVGIVLVVHSTHIGGSYIRRYSTYVHLVTFGQNLPETEYSVKG